MLLELVTALSAGHRLTRCPALHHWAPICIPGATGWVALTCCAGLPCNTLTSHAGGRQLWDVACRALRFQPLLNSEASRALSHMAAQPQLLLLSRCAGNNTRSVKLHRPHQAVRRALQDNTACPRRQSPRSWSAPSESICACPGGRRLYHRHCSRKSEAPFVSGIKWMWDDEKRARMSAPCGCT